MNNSFVLRQSRLFAERVKESAGEDVVKQIDRAFQLALTRRPTRQEHAQMLTLIREHDLSSACWVLLNSSEFLYSN
jgi:predicted metal-dependent TIM-barrel fold hydrolase